jgi:hypothetical protein
MGSMSRFKLPAPVYITEIDLRKVGDWIGAAIELEFDLLLDLGKLVVHEPFGKSVAELGIEGRADQKGGERSAALKKEVARALARKQHGFKAPIHAADSKVGFVLIQRTIES